MDYEVKSPSLPDIGDYLKIFACTAVMLQTILSLALQTNPNVKVQIGIGIIYNLIKFTAPAFITGILYTTIRVTGQSGLTYPSYLRQMWHSLFLPTIIWTAIYLFTMPWVQQVQRFHTLGGFGWQLLTAMPLRIFGTIQ